MPDQTPAKTPEQKFADDADRLAGEIRRTAMAMTSLEFTNRVRKGALGSLRHTVDLLIFLMNGEEDRLDAAIAAEEAAEITASQPESVS